MNRLRPHLTYANVISTIALFCVLGGGAYAAGKIGAKDIKRGAVKTPKLAKKAVKAPKIAGGAVKAGKLADGAVRTPKLGDNAVTGPKVDEASLGTVPSADSATTALSAGIAQTAADAQAVNGRTAGCPAGMTAVAGLCFDSDDRGNATWPDAVDDCAGDGRSLPTMGQLIGAASGLGNVGVAGTEWVDSFFVDDANNRALGVDSMGDVFVLNIASSHPYRCVTQLLR